MAVAFGDVEVAAVDDMHVVKLVQWRGYQPGGHDAVSASTAT